MRILSTCAAVISSASSGDAWRGEDVETGVVPRGVGPEQLRLGHRGVVAGDVGERLLRLDVEERRDLAELEVEVDEDDPVRLLAGLDHRHVRRDRRRPDAAARAVDRDRPALAGDDDSVRRDDGA